MLRCVARVGVFLRVGVLGCTALAALVSVGGRQALASAGCDAVNAGGFNGSGTSFFLLKQTIAGFAIGDAVTFTITSVVGPSSELVWRLFSGNFTQLNELVTSSSMTVVRSYTVTGNNQDTTLNQIMIARPGASGTVTATCKVAATSTDSDKVRALQIAASKLVAQTSGAAITGAVDGAIGDAFGNGGTPVTFGPNGITFNFAAEPRSEMAQRTDDAFPAL